MSAEEETPKEVPPAPADDEKDENTKADELKYITDSPTKSSEKVKVKNIEDFYSTEEGTPNDAAVQDMEAGEAKKPKEEGEEQEPRESNGGGNERRIQLKEDDEKNKRHNEREDIGESHRTGSSESSGDSGASELAALKKEFTIRKSRFDIEAMSLQQRLGTKKKKQKQRLIGLGIFIILIGGIYGIIIALR